MRYSLRISPTYRKAMFDALVVQIVLALLSAVILDGGVCAQICVIALLAFWGGAAVLIWRRPHAPSQTDIFLIRFGYFAVLFMAAVLVPVIWHWKGVK